MAIFEIQTPDGKTFQVDAPDAQTAYSALDHVNKPQVGTGEDMLRSGAAGAAQGAVGLAGIPGDVANLATEGAYWGAGKLGLMTPEQIAEDRRITEAHGKLPTSAQVIGAANNAIRSQPGAKTFMEYQPQTGAGEVAQRAGRLVPGVMMGPGGWLAKGAQVAGGTAGGEVGHGIGKAVGHEDIGDFVGTLAGVGLPALAERAPSVPTTQQFKAATDNAYTQARASGNKMPAMDYYQTVDDLKKLAERSGADAQLTPNVTAALKKLDARATSKDLSVDDIDTARKVLKMGEDVMKPNERRLIRRLVHEYDKRVDTAVPQELKDARALNVRYKKSELMDDIKANAELKAGQYTQSGPENATRTMYRQLGMNKAKMRQFDPAERAAIRRVAMGTKPTNAARWVGKFAPSGVVSALPTILSGGMVGGITGDAHLGAAVASAVATAGMGGKIAANALTGRSARLAEELIRGGKTGAAAARSMRGEKRIGALVRALLTTQVATAGGHPVD